MAGEPDQTERNDGASRQRFDDLMNENRHLRSELQKASAARARAEADCKAALGSLADLTRKLDKGGDGAGKKRSRRKKRLFF